MTLEQKTFEEKYGIIPGWVLESLRDVVVKRGKGLLVFVCHEGGFRNAHKTREIVHPTRN